MPTLLHIHTGLEKAYTGLSRDHEVLAYRDNYVQKDHGSFLQPAILSLMEETGLSWSDIDAISVVNGPGSYTGLRVGLAAAKGICYAASKPLICLSTLEWLAWPFQTMETDLICPLIDARRMEVFTAMYNGHLKPVIAEHPEIIDDNSFPEREHNRIIFTGNGCAKLPEAIKLHQNVIFPSQQADITEQTAMALKRFANNAFDDLAYTEPNYGKGFYSPVR